MCVRERERLSQWERGISHEREPIAGERRERGHIIIFYFLFSVIANRWMSFWFNGPDLCRGFSTGLHIKWYSMEQEPIYVYICIFKSICKIYYNFKIIIFILFVLKYKNINIISNLITYLFSLSFWIKIITISR